jgi:hypothetical protein
MQAFSQKHRLIVRENWRRQRQFNCHIALRACGEHVVPALHPI